LGKLRRWWRALQPVLEEGDAQLGRAAGAVRAAVAMSADALEHTQKQRAFQGLKRLVERLKRRNCGGLAKV